MAKDRRAPDTWIRMTRGTCLGAGKGQRQAHAFCLEGRQATSMCVCGVVGYVRG